jgi:hypothetical protein
MSNIQEIAALAKIIIFFLNYLFINTVSNERIKVK